MDWIFQAVPRRYDLRRELREGRREVWLVTRYGEQMRRGDVVYFWMAGDSAIRGLYGWGRIIANAPRQTPIGMGIEVQYEKVFSNHIPAATLQEQAILKDHLLFRMPVGTNFSLTTEQRQAIDKVISQIVGPQAVPHG
jgi:hypothetical protein